MPQELNGHRIPEGLPDGRLVTPRDPRTDKPLGEPVLWVSEQPVAEVGARWAALVQQHDRTGLWPLLLTTDSGPVGPWHNGELDPDPPERADRLEAGDLLANRWSQFLQDEIEPNRIPQALRRWPGVAPEAPQDIDPDACAVSLATTRAKSKVGVNVFYGGKREIPGGMYAFTNEDGSAYLGLVAARDSAGAASAVGWTHNSPAPAELTAVFRSWQKRFGVRLCAYGSAALAVSVARPPLTKEHARRLAVEHIAFCPDNLVDDTFEAYAAGLVGAGVWSFWWD
ncbi:DUF4253 domain-containing protein [Actinomadura sp. 6N118]|uniref:DUF4253 domain-containing protein n=1 Tax=Actinomadura sp. 6N118 TaxID=3375151 RepID=UPI0037B93616